MRLTEEQYAALLRTRRPGGAPPHAQAGRAAPEPEARFLARVLTLAQQQGWLVYHTHRSDRSPPGFPDLVLCRETVLWVELKTQTGKLTEAQMMWMQSLHQAGQETYLWRPKDWEEIVGRLAQPTKNPFWGLSASADRGKKG